MTNEEMETNQLNDDLDTIEEASITTQEEIEENTTELNNENETALLQAQNSELEDRILRLQAEIANMKRINQKERQDLAKYRSQSFATQLVDVVDNLERAIAIETNSEEGNAIKKGVEMVYQQLLAAFEKEQVEIINPLNETFDPNYHQAVSVIAAQEGQESDIVTNVLQKGYRLHDRILRPAMVIVSE